MMNQLKALTNFGKETFLFRTPVRIGDASGLSRLKGIPTTAMAEENTPSLLRKYYTNERDRGISSLGSNTHETL